MTDSPGSSSGISQISSRCELCDCELPPGEGGRAIHEAGARHSRARAERQAFEELVTRSVFLKFPDGSMTKEQLESILTTLADDPERLLWYADKPHFAVAEFSDPDVAKKLIEAGQIQGPNSVQIAVSARRLPPTGNAASAAVASPFSALHRIPWEEIKVQLAEKGGTFAEQLDFAIKAIEMPAKEIEKRRQALARLEQALREFLHEPKVHLFGSCATPLTTLDSDVDAWLEVGHDPASALALRDKLTLLTGNCASYQQKKLVAAELRKLLPHERVRCVSRIMREVRRQVPESHLGAQQQLVLDAKCPLVRILVDKIPVELSMSNSASEAKSALLKRVVEAEKSGKLRRLLLVARLWALSNGLLRGTEKDAQQHHFNSYTMNLVVLAFLQQHAGLLPALGTIASEPREIVWPSDLTEKAVLKAMFVHYIQNHSPKDTVLILRDGTVQPRSQFKTPDGFRWSFLNVQDPLEEGHNVAQNVSEQMQLSLAAWKRGDGESLSAILGVTLSPVEKAERETDMVWTVKTTKTIDPDRFVELIFGKALGFEVLDGEDDVAMEEPSPKRSRPSSQKKKKKSSVEKLVIVKRNVWVGRRQARNLLRRQVQGDEIDLEQAATRSMAENQTTALQKARQLEVKVSSAETGALTVKMWARGENEWPSLDLGHLKHFLDTFLPKIVPAVEKRVLGSVTEEEEEKMEE